MGGMGNGRRGGRSPPLMIGALIACVLVLGFNYWMSNSRNVELQTKLYEIEARMRRAASERGAVEVKKNEFQEEIHRLKEESSRMQMLNKRLEGVQNTCSQEKASQQLNISSSTKTIQELKSQLHVLKEDLGKCQKELQSCSGNLNTLNKKITYDMTQCNTQILAQREECAEKVAAAKQEVQKKLEKMKPSLGSQNNTAPTQKVGTVKVMSDKEDGPRKTALDDTKTTPVNGHAPEPSLAKSFAADPKASELETNEIVVDKAPVLPLKESQPSADVKGAKPEAVQETKLRKSNMTETTVLEVMDTHGEPHIEGRHGDQTACLRSHFKAAECEDYARGCVETGQSFPFAGADPVADYIQLSQGKGEEAPIGQKRGDPEEDYDADEQIVGGVDLDKQNQMAEKIDKEAEREMQEELADYNGDDENEGEFEADKQAALAQF